MPPRGVRSAKRARQYEHIKESALRRGRSTKRTTEIAAAAVNKQRSEAGDTNRSSRSMGPTSRKTSTRSRSRSIKRR